MSTITHIGRTETRGAVSRQIVSPAAVEAMSVKLKAYPALTRHELDQWARFRASNSTLYSPYFHPGYTELVAKLCDDVRIICVYEQDEPIGFLPIQGQSFARPVGAPFTDYHGLICAPDRHMDLADILKRAGIGAYHYNAMIGLDESDYQSVDYAAAINISAGALNWRAAQDSSYKRYLKNCGRKIKRSKRDLGEIEVISLSQDKDIFDTMIRWKREQYADTGKYDVLSANWALSLLEELFLRGPEASLRVDMFALKLGGQLAAIDTGLSDGVTYHSWMVSYNKELRQYSPGMQLLEALLDQADKVGYQIIDLGAGLDGYKKHYSDIEQAVGQGFIAAKGLPAVFAKGYNQLEKMADKAPIGGLGQLPGKLRRRYSQVAACDPKLSGRAKAMFTSVKRNMKANS